MTHTDEVVEKLRAELLVNFCDGYSWEDARAVTFTQHGVLDIALFFYELGLEAAQSAKVEEVRGIIESIRGETSPDSCMFCEEIRSRCNAVLSPNPAEVTSDKK